MPLQDCVSANPLWVTYSHCDTFLQNKIKKGRKEEGEKGGRLNAVDLPAFLYLMQLATETPFVSSQMHVQQLSAAPWASHPAVLTPVQTPMKSMAHIHHFTSTTWWKRNPLCQSTLPSPPPPDKTIALSPSFTSILHTIV